MPGQQTGTSKGADLICQDAIHAFTSKRTSKSNQDYDHPWYPD
jgi:hypothetical protein